MSPRDEADGLVLSLAGATLLADRSGALYWPDEDTLIVADLHLEKGSSFARFRTHLPPYETNATLGALEQLMDHYEPRRVVALGDSVHDHGGWHRLDTVQKDRLSSLVARPRQWVWIAGNHDPKAPEGMAGTSVDELTIGLLTLRHEPGGDVAPGRAEIAGHLHPAARVIGRGGSARRPAFAHDEKRLILPAFGAYAGGLCLSAKPFRALFERTTFMAAVCGRGRVFRVPGNRVVGWG